MYKVMAERNLKHCYQPNTYNITLKCCTFIKLENMFVFNCKWDNIIIDYFFEHVMKNVKTP